MNAQKGLTARKGGANDPSVIQSKLKAGQTAYNPSSSGKPATTTLKTSPASNQSTQAGQVARSAYGSTQSVATSLATSKPAQASGSDITDKATYDTKTTKPAPFQPGPSSVKLSPEPQKFSGSAEGPAPVAKPAAPAPEPMMTNFKPSGPMGDMPKMSDQPPSSVSAPKPAAPAPEPKKKEAGAVPAAPMAESYVAVGANKYRIV
jgi:hypothetical protein